MFLSFMSLIDYLEEHPEIKKMLKNDKPYVTNFCKEEGVKLLRTDVTTEKGYPELMYIFSDNLGGYTIDGIKSSLK